MKKRTFILIISILTATGCIAQQNQEKFAYNFHDANNSVLNFYRQYSSYTDPGEYAYLFKNLPDSLTELCKLIKSLTIHPYAELPRYVGQIPKERISDEFKYNSAKSILEGLLSYDSSVLGENRKPEDRLIVGCWHNSILLASILKYRCIPARLRSGHATYLIPNFHASHTICEVWNENEKRWMLVDPSTGMIDFSSKKFDFSNEAWIKLQNNEIEPTKFGFPGRYTGLISIVGKISPDLAMVLGTEYPIYQYAPILDDAFDKDKQLSAEQTETLNKICELMKSLDADNLSKLQEIYNNTPEIQMTKTFEGFTTNAKK